MKIVFLDAATMGDASMAEIAALGDFTCYPSSTPEEARARAADADVVLLNKVVVDRAFLDAYRRRSVVLGKEITCTIGPRIFRAKALEIDDTGALIVQGPDGERETLRWGEVSIRL